LVPRHKSKAWTALLLGAILACLNVASSACAPPRATPESRPELGSSKKVELPAAFRRQLEFEAWHAKILEEARPVFEDMARNDWSESTYQWKTTWHSVVDAAPRGDSRVAFSEILAVDATAQRVGMLDWKLVEEPTLEDFQRVHQFLNQRLPGKIEMGLFLDEGLFGDGVRALRNAWGDRPLSDVPHPEQLDTYLAGQSGNTLIAVGHVEGTHFVFKDSVGATIALSIPELLIKSRQHDVRTIVLGCSTARAGAAIGFLKEIGTTAVARFLSGLGDTPTFADVLAGFRSIGEFRVNLRDMLNQLDVQVVDSQSESQLPQQLTRVKFEYCPSHAGVQQSSLTVASWSKQIDVGAEAIEGARLWFQKRWARDLMGSWITWLVLLTVGVFCLATGLLALANSPWARARRSRLWFASAARTALGFLGPLFVVLLFLDLGILIVSFPIVLAPLAAFGAIAWLVEKVQKTSG
jgi:hypothetical protein